MGATAWGLSGAKSKRAQQVGYGMGNQIWQVVSSPGPEGPDRQGPETKPPQNDARPDGPHGPGETGRPKNQETAAPPRGTARAGPAAPGTDTTGPTMHLGLCDTRDPEGIPGDRPARPTDSGQAGMPAGRRNGQSDASNQHLLHPTAGLSS